MTLIFVGLGQSLKHLTKEAVEALSDADKIYVDTYTSLYEDPLESLKALNARAPFVYAKRADLEGPSIYTILEEAKEMNVVIAVPGDPFIATTHDTIMIEALQRGIGVKVVNGISVITMIYSRLGLQSYKFGKHVTLVYPTHFKPWSVVDTIYDNMTRNLHTVVLLELSVEESKAMTINEAVQIIEQLDERGHLKKQLAIAVARLGWRDERICADTFEKLASYRYPPPPHTIVIPAPRLDPVEQEFLKVWKRQCSALTW